MATVTPKRMHLDLRFVTSVENPTGTGYTEGSWVVEDGQPGAQPGVIGSFCLATRHIRAFVARTSCGDHPHAL